MATKPIDNVLSRLQGVKNGTARCPAHGDAHNSLKVSEAPDGAVLLHCHAGCDTKDVVSALGLTMADLFPSRDGHEPPRNGRGPRPPVTVESLAADKRLPADHLRSFGLHDLPGGGVGIPYKDAKGQTLQVKRRTAPIAKEGSFWPKGVPLMAYGLDRLERGREAGYLVLVEGESDCWTCWLHDLPALGVPGANSFKVLEPEHLEGIGKVYVIQEPDKGGVAFVPGIEARLRELGWHGAAYVVRLDGAKDPNELHKLDPDGFPEAFQKAMAAAEPLRGPTQPAQYLYRPRELRTSSLADLLADDEAEDIPHLVERLLAVGGVALLAGKPGEGKTWVILLLALIIAAGGRFLDRFSCVSGPVLILDEENGLRRLRKRLRRLCVALGLDPATLAPIEIASMNGVDLGNADWTDAVRAKMDSLHPLLVIVDSLVRIHKGDENNSRDVANLFSIVTELRTEFGAAFLFTHHLRKKGLINDPSERVRGSSDIEAYVDCLLVLERVDNRLILRQVKSRDDEPIKPLALEIADTDEGGTIVKTVGEIDEETEKRETARALIKELVADGPKLREVLVEAGGEAGLSERTMSDALKDLVSTKEITRGKEGRKTIYAPAQPAQPAQPTQGDMGEWTA